MLQPPTRPLAFWHVAGDIVWRGDGRPTAIAEAMARSLRGTFAEEAAAFAVAGDQKGAVHACRMWLQLTEALDGLETWRGACVANAGRSA